MINYFEIDYTFPFCKLQVLNINVCFKRTYTKKIVPIFSIIEWLSEWYVGEGTASREYRIK